MGTVFIILAIGLITLSVFKLRKKKVESNSNTGGIDLPKDKVDHIEDEDLKPE